jgi:hypothetical protein
MDWLRQYVPAHVTDADEPFLADSLVKCYSVGIEILKKNLCSFRRRKSSLHAKPYDAPGPESCDFG